MKKVQRWPREIQSTQSKDKRNTKKCNFGASLVFKEMKCSMRSLMLNEINGVVTLWQDPTQLILQPIKGKGLGDFLGLNNNRKPVQI